MRLGNIDCGCDNRRYIMFQAGKMGLPEAAILAASVALILIAKKVNHASVG
jgi:hypothetical protein